VLNVFENEGCMKAVISWMQSQAVYRTYNNNYLFMTIDQMMREGAVGWWMLLTWEVKSLFD
jgi:hypothetical protein